ncbi:hypothetical protein KIPB_002277, partial [Kipferlia bialata]|eukprot:g2277.t1
MTTPEYENAACRTNYPSGLFQAGVGLKKEEVLGKMDPGQAAMHRDGGLHIHDLEAHGLVPNCSSPVVSSVIKAEALTSTTDTGKMSEIMDGYRALITRLATQQSGGIGFSKFDIDTAALLSGIEFNDQNKAHLHDCIVSLTHWFNTERT